MTRLRFRVDGRATGSRARAARFHTEHGEVSTPVFVPVGTQATVRALSVDDLHDAGSTVLLANAYHLLLRPGPEVFMQVGGIHRFMNWDGPVSSSTISARFGEWQSADSALVWALLEGDFRSRLADAPAPDVIFYDPFSARTNAEMWTLACFERVFAACAAHDTELFTYSASTSVRAALLGAGFLVGRGVPTGTKPETTLAMTPSAALRAGIRGRVLLGAPWLERWRRSDASVPGEFRPTTGPRSPRGYRGSRSFGAPASRRDGALSRHRDVRRR